MLIRLGLHNLEERGFYREPAFLALCRISWRADERMPFADHSARNACNGIEFASDNSFIGANGASMN